MITCTFAGHREVFGSCTQKIENALEMLIENEDTLYCYVGGMGEFDGFSAAVFKDICRQAGVPFQTFTNRSDMPGGSTLGNISMAQVSVNAVDVGLPQLAMHSPYETAGAKDTDYFIKAATVFFE